MFLSNPLYATRCCSTVCSFPLRVNSFFMSIPFGLDVRRFPRRYAYALRTSLRRSAGSSGLCLGRPKFVPAHVFPWLCHGVSPPSVAGLSFPRYAGRFPRQSGLPERFGAALSYPPCVQAGGLPVFSPQWLSTKLMMSAVPGILLALLLCPTRRFC